MTPDLLPLQQNLSLKRYFTARRLDLEAVMERTPHDLDLENWKLQKLVDFIEEYRYYGSREAMEAVNGWVYPPIFPGISPESDWMRFELWMQGKPIQKRLGDMFPKGPPFQRAEDLSDEEVALELERLLQAIREAGVCPEYSDEIPRRLLYAHLYATLDDLLDVDDGAWVIGCGAWCPGCIQRPWCKAGGIGTWLEDEQVGKMCLPDELAPYVSASPQSLALLIKAQEEEDAVRPDMSDEEFEDLFGMERKPDEDWLAKRN